MIDLVGYVWRRKCLCNGCDVWAFFRVGDKSRATFSGNYFFSVGTAHSKKGKGRDLDVDESLRLG